MNCNTTHYRANSSSVPGDPTALGAKPAERKAREALWARLRAALDKARDPAERELVIRALGSFDDPALVVRSYDLVLDGTLRSQDLRTVRSASGGRAALNEATWAWFTKSFDALVAKLGAKAAPGLPAIAGGFCAGADAERVRAFFDGKKASIPSGLEHNVASTLEGIRECATLRAMHLAAVKKWAAR